MISYKLELFHNVANFIAKNVADHFKDASKENDYDALEMDWDYYLEASQQGKCVAVVVYDDETPIGYSVFFIENNPHSKKILEATNSGIYVKPEYRGPISMELMDKSEQILRDIGVNEINYTVKSERVGNLLERKGFKSEYRVWSKKYG